jgi:hypothetical protein
MTNFTSCSPRINILALALLFTLFSSAQKTEKKQLKEGVRVSNEDRRFLQKPKKYFYYQNDKNGNTTFSLNQGMNGDITMISASEFDSLNRETKAYWVHSNLGYYLSEKVYETNRVLHYHYESEKEEEFSHDRKALEGINTQQTFINLPVFQVLSKAKRQLTSIEILDSNGNVLQDIRLNKEGDTSSVVLRQYNALNQEILFQYITPGSTTWTWDIFSEYDENGNHIKDFRVKTSDGIADTSEIRNYYYNDSNLLVLQNYYNGTRFQNKTEYFYNAQGYKIKEVFYEYDEIKLDVETIYSYFKTGYLKKEVSIDYRARKPEREVIKSRIKYW